MTIHSYHRGPGIPEDILAISHERDLLRRRGQYERADKLKQQLEDAGYGVKDNPRGAHLIILPSITVDGTLYRTARQLPSYLGDTDTCTFSVNILVQNASEQAQRCVTSILRHADKVSLEILLIDNASSDGLERWADILARTEPRLHILRTSRPMGHAEAYNLGLKQSRGRYILLLDTNLEVTGDIFTPLAQTLSNEEVCLTGARGLCTDDLRHFEESSEEEVEVIDGSCMAFPRALLRDIDLFDERYRYPQYMDVDFSFTARDTGGRAIVTSHLPLISHPAIRTSNLSETERTRLIKRNFYRYLGKWGSREDLLLGFEEVESDIDEDLMDEED